MQDNINFAPQKGGKTCKITNSSPKMIMFSSCPVCQTLIKTQKGQRNNKRKKTNSNTAYQQSIFAHRFSVLYR